jgi:hypothetical protein
MTEGLRGPEKKKGKVSAREAAEMEEELFRREQEEKARKAAALEKEGEAGVQRGD